MLEEETQDSLVLFPINRKNSDVSRVGDFYEQDRVFILVYVKFLFTVIESLLFLPKIHPVSQMFRMYVVLVLCILFYSSLDMQSL
jgi:hypothetical protein